ncbi:MAG: GNAT family N-acetyltransferase [Clostridium sp.]|uniref:GNAT family N-acetyltransferase n=1 Tax=Clostridium sp. TaxID=1506 RepID=UPI001EB9EEF9|nr:GNAT family N-acetyltransferase [Clostridium sp.]MBS5885847.1 GNAT family N-acetyltransferase [Clostridium sp.]MDU7149857.1 GNAT family N-acetyltransferase [Clostridium sp.]MDU7242278.1 GNAT family N-acetyltransferase [Clostridium sp.]
MDNILIRKARDGDEVEILNLVEEVLNLYGLDLNPEVEDLDITDISKYYIQNNGDFEVIEFNGDIIGTYGIYKINDETCELRKMYLKQDFQGMGLGNIMIENSFKIAKSLDYKRITLQTNSVLYKAIKLYKKYGFEDFNEDVCARCDIAMVKKIA